MVEVTVNESVKSGYAKCVVKIEKMDDDKWRVEKLIHLEIYLIPFLDSPTKKLAFFAQNEILTEPQSTLNL